MATLARLFDFIPGDIIRSADVDAEFNQIIALVNGTSLNIQTILQLDDAALATLKLNQVKTTVGATAFEIHTGGIQRIKVDGAGRLHSTVVGDKVGTGNEPLVVASTKLVTNLNADMVDGLHASDLMSVAAGTFASDVTISNADPRLTFDDTDVGDVGDCYFELDTDGTDQQLSLRRKSDSQRIQRWNISQGTSQFHNVAVLRTDAGADVDISVAVGGSSPNQHLTPKKYVDDRKVQWAITAYYNGVISGSMKTGQFILPQNVREFTATHFKILYQGGTPISNTTISVSRIRAGVTTALGSVTLTNLTAINTIVTNDIADDVLQTDDIITWSVSAAGGHSDVSVTLSGFQKVSTN